MYLSYKIRTVLVLAVFVFKGDTKRPSLRDAAKQEPRDYRPTKWLANSAMDVWYGNKSMIDIIAREMSDVMLKLTARPVRSVLRYRSQTASDFTQNPKYEPYHRVSRVEINFINSNNDTFQTIKLEPMKQIRNNTVFRVLEPLLRIRDY